MLFFICKLTSESFPQSFKVGLAHVASPITTLASSKFFLCCVQRLSYSQFHTVLWKKTSLFTIMLSELRQGLLQKDAAHFYPTISILLPKNDI